MYRFGHAAALPRHDDVDVEPLADGAALPARRVSWLSSHAGRSTRRALRDGCAGAQVCPAGSPAGVSRVATATRGGGPVPEGGLWDTLRLRAWSGAHRVPPVASSEDGAERDDSRGRRHLRHRARRRAATRPDTSRSIRRLMGAPSSRKKQPLGESVAGARGGYPGLVHGRRCASDRRGHSHAADRAHRLITRAVQTVKPPPSAWKLGVPMWAAQGYGREKAAYGTGPMRSARSAARSASKACCATLAEV